MLYFNNILYRTLKNRMEGLKYFGRITGIPKINIRFVDFAFTTSPYTNTAYKTILLFSTGSFSISLSPYCTQTHCVSLIY